jgi:hypothetical protein
MIKPVAIIISFAASLLLWSIQGSGEAFAAENTYESSAQYNAQAPASNVSVGHSSGLFQDMRTRFSGLKYGLLWNAFKSGETTESAAPQSVSPQWGTPLPAQQQSAAQQSMPPAPAEPQPNGFFGGFFAPTPYPQGQPAAVSYGPPPGQYGVPQAYGQGYGGYPPGAPGSASDQRIVYVPYAAPPPIYVERLGKALSRPPKIRRILGDANMYEYPEMPMQTYTTRGPRDFLAPNPPSIGY